jgi:hypothetical protein
MKRRTADEKEKRQSRLETEQAAEKLGNRVTGRARTEKRRPMVGIIGSVAERRNTRAKSLAETEQSERQELRSGKNTMRTWEHSCRATDTPSRNREPASCMGKTI